MFFFFSIFYGFFLRARFRYLGWVGYYCCSSAPSRAVLDARRSVVDEKLFNLLLLYVILRLFLWAPRNTDERWAQAHGSAHSVMRFLVWGVQFESNIFLHLFVASFLSLPFFPRAVYLSSLSLFLSLFPSFFPVRPTVGDVAAAVAPSILLPVPKALEASPEHLLLLRARVLAVRHRLCARIYIYIFFLFSQCFGGISIDLIFLYLVDIRGTLTKTDGALYSTIRRGVRFLFLAFHYCCETHNRESPTIC